VEEILEALPPALTGVSVQHLAGTRGLWGGDVADERYAVIAQLPAGARR